MAFDAGFTRAVCAELTELLAGAKVEKVTEPTKDELLIICYKAGKTRKLFISANPARRQNPTVSAHATFRLMLRKSG